MVGGGSRKYAGALDRRGPQNSGIFLVTPIKVSRFLTHPSRVMRKAWHLLAEGPFHSHNEASGSNRVQTVLMARFRLRYLLVIVAKAAKVCRASGVGIVA